MAASITNAAAIAALNALTALLNVGGAGSLRIYSGSVPANADASLGAAGTLATFALAADAFGDATDANPGAVAVADTIADVNAAANGTATFFRLLNNAGTAVLQGTVSASGGGGDCIVTSVTFVSGQPCHVVSITLTHPE